MPRPKLPPVTAPEWSVPVIAQDISAARTVHKIVATEEERQNLARRLDLISIEELKAEITLHRQNKLVVHVTGNLEARITQACIKTLQPVPQHIEDSFEAWYADQQQALSFAKAKAERQERKGGEGERPMLEEHEDPEPIIDGVIDLGELATQYLSLSIDPYPYAEGVERPETDEIVYAEETENPFAALKNLRPGKDEE